jgi:hypothetical protein
MVGYCGMGTQFTVIASQRLVVLTFDGTTSVEDLESTGAAILSHPDFDPSFSQIIDCTKLTKISFSADTIRELTRSERTFNPTSTRVIVAPQAHIYGLARMAQAFATRTLPNLVVVRTMAEALEALSKAK